MRWLLVAGLLVTAAAAPRRALADDARSQACCGPADLACNMALSKKTARVAHPLSERETNSMLIASLKRGLAYEIGAWVTRLSSPFDAH